MGFLDGLLYVGYLGGGVFLGRRKLGNGGVESLEIVKIFFSLGWIG